MTDYEKLVRYFEDFPGIGSRQAKRFVDHLLVSKSAELEELAGLITTIQTAVATCGSCFRFYSPPRGGGGAGRECSVCSDSGRDRAKLMVVERDCDALAVEKAGEYRGLYFVLGGTVPLLNTPKVDSLRGGALKALAGKRALEGELSEVILAFSINPDGENTARYVVTLLKDLLDEKKLKVTTLGRGLSTGSELEYADPETIKSALGNRSRHDG